MVWKHPFPETLGHASPLHRTAPLLGSEAASDTGQLRRAPQADPGAWGSPAWAQGLTPRPKQP